MQSTRTCTFPGCEKGIGALGLCNGHYEQQRLGRPLAPLRRSTLGWPLEARMDFYTDKSGDCWMWTSIKGNKGHGRLYVDGRQVPAHRIAFELANGPIPRGMFIDHKCRNASCVRPEHLQAVTNKENAENLDGARAINRTGIRGVGWHPRTRTYRVRVMHDGREYSGGYFKSVEDAESAAIALRNRLFTNNLRDRAEATSNGTEQAA